MEAVQITAATRDKGGKSAAQELRREGFLPGVLYSKEAGNVLLRLSAKETEKLISEKGESALYKIVMEQEGKPEIYTTLLREVQRHPLRGDLIHLDFYQISLKDKLKTAVPLHFQGEPEGARNGGILQYGAREVEVECLPVDLPASLTVDVSGLDIGDSLSVADLSAPEGVEIVSDSETLVATIVAPRMAEDEAETIAEAGEDAEAEDETD